MDANLGSPCCSFKGLFMLVVVVVVVVVSMLELLVVDMAAISLEMLLRGEAPPRT